ncbi:MAG TPA: xanthine dehydrogenase family protein molybdopterin-binding subunit [Acidimicrobiales bacterium]|nr:xanthine dehydrogenase family protein molybdopterin-binding subunit [Acidimicrobiales bacterium]
MTTAPATIGRVIGQRVKRKEDPRLLTGRGRYLDDVTMPGLLHAHFLRSDVARANITIDVTAAREAEGVVAVFTGEDLNPHIKGDMHTGPAEKGPLTPLSVGYVRHVGDPIALVVARSRYLAEDAADLIDVDYEPLPAVVDFEAALGDTDHLVHPELEDNVCVHMEVPADDELAEIFRTAAHVVTDTIRQHRYIPVPMEPRGIIVDWRPVTNELEIRISTQAPHHVRAAAAKITGVPEHWVHVVMDDVGGGFGQKAFLPRDEQCVILAAHLLGRPVKWVEDRRENLTAATHSRTERVTATLAADEEGHLLGAYIDHLDDAGAYPLYGSGGAGAFVAMLFSGPYRMGKLAWKTTSVYTNTCTRGAYRGPWQMETLAREQMLDLLAHRMGLDPLELRRRNVIHRSELPYTMPSGMEVAEVSPEETLEQAAEMIGYEQFRKDQAAAAADGRYIGVGLALYVEPQPGMGPMGSEPAHIRVAPEGHVDVYLGSGAHGQGIETTTAQIVAEHLGIDPDDVAVHQGDTASTPFAFGTGGSRSGPMLGAAVLETSLAVREKVLAIAGHMLEASPDDLDIAAGVISVAGDPTSSVTLRHVAQTAYHNPAGLPPGMEAGLDISQRYAAPPFAFSNACHVVTVAVDPDLGTVEILRYVVSEDCGVMINPNIVEGQVAGGVVQGVGGVLYEEFVYDDDGNPLTTTFLDYLLPTACEAPDVEYGHIETPALTPGGFKGVGEGGAIGAPPAIVNAVIDALRPLGVELLNQPLTPPRVLEAIDEARASS